MLGQDWPCRAMEESMTEEELRGARRKAQEVWTETDDVDARGSRCDMWETYVGRREGRDFEVDLGEGYLREGCGLQASCGDKRPSEQVLDAMAAEENRSARQRDAREEGMRKRERSPWISSGIVCKSRELIPAG